MTKKELGESYFQSGYNCAQSVALAFAEEMGVDSKTAISLSAGFGGGFGRMREVCGAVSGMVIVLGALEGDYPPEDNTAKMEFYKKVQGLMNQFQEENGSFICRDLLNLPEGPSAPTPEERTPSYYKKRPCGELVGSACEILDRYLHENT